MPLDQVTLRVAARPVRILSLVRTREEITRSIRLFTHLWGGGANAILPLPQVPVGQAFEDAVRSYDPDHILTPRDGVSAEARAVLSSIACYGDYLTENAVQEHVEGPNLFHFRRGSLAHTGRVLLTIYPTGFPESSNIRVVESGSPYEFVIGLHYGLPSNAYSTFLQRHLRARQLHGPNSFGALLRALIIAGARSNARTVSLSNTQSNISRTLFGEPETTPISSSRAERELTLFLFLDDGEDVGLPCAFWNSRRIGTGSNRLLLPKDLFLNDIHQSLQAISSVNAFDEVVVIMRGTDEESEFVRATLIDALAALGVDAPVDVYFRDYEFEMAPGTLRVGSLEAMTRTADSEGVIRFAPPAQVGANTGTTVFGFDASVEFANGVQLSLPSNPWTSVLLQNSMDRIVRAERNEQGAGRLWLHQGGAPSMRAVPKGIAGVTVAGEECYLHLHPDEVTVEHLLKERGLRIKSNTHTLFAAGFARKYGGIDATLSLVREGGARIIRALSARRAEASGLLAPQISGFLRQTYGLSQQQATDLVGSLLPRLSATGLVRRGTGLTCPHCGLRDWYAVKELNEFMECTGCAQQFQLSAPGIQYAYRANELSKRLIETGGHAVLMTAAGLRAIDRSGVLHFGGDVSRGSDQANFAELDLIMMTSETVLAAECKDYDSIDEEDVREIIASLERTLVAAVELRADVLILGISSTSVPAHLFAETRAFAVRVETLGLAVHVMVNGKLHYQCADEEIDEPALRLKHLKLERRMVGGTINHVGSLRASIGFGFSDRGSSEIVERWEAQLGI